MEKTAQLVQAHHLGHGGKDHGSIEVVPRWGYRLDHFVGQVFNKDQGGHEDIRRRHILLKGLEIIGIPQFFNQVAADFNGHLGVVGVDGPNRRGQSTLVLRL
jgi:hypothetical protein